MIEGILEDILSYFIKFKKLSIENKVSYDFGEDVVVLDATFTPIRKADYLAEPARVGLDKNMIKYISM